MSEHASTNSHWTATDVANQFEEAVYTLKKLPPVRVQGYFCLFTAGVADAGGSAHAGDSNACSHHPSGANPGLDGVG